MKDLNLSYAEIRLMRELLVEELRPTYTSITVQHMILIEHMLQTIIMAGLNTKDVEAERKHFKGR